MNKLNISEDQNKPPAKQWLSSIGQQLYGSPVVAILLGTIGTKMAYNLGLPEAAAASLASQIQALCLGGGFIATASAAIQLPLRGRDLTQDRLQRSKVTPSVWPMSNVSQSAEAQSSEDAEELPDDDGTPSE